ncbi:MAG: DUF502 domain-containing protein [Paracoccaceae bacterium]
MDHEEAESAPKAGRRRVTLLQRLRYNFLTGLVVVVPVVVTVWLTWASISFVDAQVMPFVPTAYDPRVYVGLDIPGYGVLVFVVFTVMVGWFAKKVFGRQLIRLGEGLVDRMPVVRSIYAALKQLVETALANSKTSFQRACLVEYPRRDVWSIAFVSTTTKGEILEAAGGGEMLSVFVPTTPNPTSGFLLFVPRRDVVLLDMSIEDAAKLVISAGLVVPPTTAETRAKSEEVAARRKAFADAVAPLEPHDRH